MKISKKTLSIFKSFAAINPVIYLGDSKALKVQGTGVVGCYKADEEFSHECAFWETPKLLATIDSMGGEEADLNFEEKFVKIASPDKSSLKYFYTPEALILQSNPKPKPYENYCKEVEPDFSFEISLEMFNKVMKLSQVMNLNILRVEFDNDKGKLSLLDDSNKVAHNFEVELEGKGNGVINLYISTMSIIPGHYSVVVKNNAFAKFTNKDIPLFYIIATKKGQNS